MAHNCTVVVAPLGFLVIIPLVLLLKASAACKHLMWCLYSTGSAEPVSHTYICGWIIKA
jgi:hypothetical protein